MENLQESCSSEQGGFAIASISRSTALRLLSALALILVLPAMDYSREWRYNPLLFPLRWFCDAVYSHRYDIFLSAIVIGLVAAIMAYSWHDQGGELDQPIYKTRIDIWRLVCNKFSNCKRCAHLRANPEKRWALECPHGSLNQLNEIAQAYKDVFGDDFHELRAQAHTNKHLLWGESVPSAPHLFMQRAEKTQLHQQLVTKYLWLADRFSVCQGCWHLHDCPEPGPHNDPPAYIRKETAERLQSEAANITEKTESTSDMTRIDRNTSRLIRTIVQDNSENPLLNDVYAPPDREEIERRKNEQREREQLAIAEAEIRRKAKHAQWMAENGFPIEDPVASTFTIATVSETQKMATIPKEPEEKAVTKKTVRPRSRIAKS